MKQTAGLIGKWFSDWWSFKSRTAMVGAWIYVLFAGWLCYVALFTSNDGGIWLLMYWSYLPVSKLYLWFSTSGIEYILDNTFIGQIPLSTLLAMLSCLVLGTLWYYWVLKTLVFAGTKMLGRRTGA